MKLRQIKSFVISLIPLISKKRGHFIESNLFNGYNNRDIRILRNYNKFFSILQRTDTKNHLIPVKTI